MLTKTTYLRPALRCALLILPLAVLASPAAAQSLLLDRGQRAVEVVAGGSFGPSSDGFESRFSLAFDGRIDVGVAINRYTYTFDGVDSSFSEIAPFARVFLAKETPGGSPISLALSAQVFIDNYEGDDSGGYVQAGPTLYKHFAVTDRVSVQPHLGFSIVRESYTFGGITDSQSYLARSLGFAVTTRLSQGGGAWLQLTLEEQSFRNETYRAARLGLIGRF